MTKLVLLLVWVLTGVASAELFDGLGGEDLPTLPTCWALCPPVPDEEFVQCWVFTRDNPFQCLTVPRYRTTDTLPPLPGGMVAWRPSIEWIGDEGCPPGTGVNARIIVQDDRHHPKDVGCWTPE